MSHRQYQSKIARVVRACDQDDFPYFVRVQGRRIPAVPYYRGSGAFIHVGDRVVILGCYGIAVEIAPIDNDAFYTPFHTYTA